MSRLRSRLQKNGFNLELLTGPLRGLFNGPPARRRWRGVASGRQMTQCAPALPDQQQPAGRRRFGRFLLGRLAHPKTCAKLPERREKGAWSWLVCLKGCSPLCCIALSLAVPIFAIEPRRRALARFRTIARELNNTRFGHGWSEGLAHGITQSIAAN